MSKKQDKRMVPDIRFPGFEGEWKFPKAGSLFKNSVFKGYEGLPIYSVTQANGMVERSSLDREFDDISDPKGNRFVKKDDIAYNMMRMWQGAVGVAPVDCMISPAYVVLAPNSDVFSQFYFKMFKSKKYLYLLTSYSQGLTSDRLRLYYKEFAQIHLPHPSREEQQKIASFLSDIDTKIEKLFRKKELLEQYKKGIMQKLFSREIRFKDENGEDFPEWEDQVLGDILYEHKLKSSGSEEVFSVSVRKGLVNQIEHLGRSFAAANTDHYNRVQPNDIVYTKSPTGDFPYGIIKQSKANRDVIVSPLYGIFRPETPNIGYILDSFFEYPVNVHNYLHSIIQKGAKNTINITNRTFLSKTINLPVSHKEQEKIASYLSDINSKIRHLGDELFAVKEFKKGLLQGMFV